MNLLKYLQKTKWISRRDYEKMVKESAIFLNWRQIEDFKTQVRIWDKLKINLEKDKDYEEQITRLPFYKPLIILFNKPRWYTVSKEDKHNKTIFELLPKSWKKDFYYIWRLDKDSHWLLLLTNEPDLVDYYENPKNKIFKIYEVEIDKIIKSSDIIKAKKWVSVDQEWNLVNWKREFEPVWDVETLDFYDIHYINKRWKHILRILLTEWKKRHIRRVLKGLWYKTLDLKRIKVWKYQLWTIKTWKYMISKI